MNKQKTSKLIGQTMHERGLSANKLSTITGLNAYQIKKVIEGTASEGVLKKICDHLEIEPIEHEPKKQGTAHVKPVGPDRFIVTIKDHGTERIEILQKDGVDKLEERYVVTFEEVKKAEDIAKPILTDDDPMLEMKKEMWVDGKKYTEDTIRIMVESAVSEHREHVELLDKVNDLQTQLEEKTKEAIHWQVQMEEYRDQLAELKQEGDVGLKDMTIGDAIKQYRVLKKLFKDEVLG